MGWNNLSMKEKASYIRMGVENGITDLGTIKEVYNKFAKEGPIKKSYKDFSTRLSRAWNNQDLSKDDYDYQKYYNDDPNRAYRQLESIEHGGKGHFPDGGKSGTYKTPNHPTHPDLGPNSWLNNGRTFNMSARQANQGVNNIREEINTDRVLDYLGSDLHYNNGATKAMYDGAYQLPSITVTPNGNYTELVPNELNTGWMYKDRAGRFDDTDYSYLDKYLSNKKSLGGNLYEDGDDNTPIEYTPSIDVYVTPKQQADRLISLGKGVYKDKVSNKLLYNYDEMPTATVVGHKKKKSVNDNLQAAYAKGIPSGTMSADMETMNAVTGGALNLLSPSQIVGAAIHSDRPQDYFLNLGKGNNGIVTDKFAQEHPYWSVGANMLFDTSVIGALSGINGIRSLASIPKFNPKGLAKSAWNSDLRYELDPRYMKVYHHTEKPFDINNFNVASSVDAGLHVSPYPNPNAGFGNVIYKGYAKKPSFEFLDRHYNGFRMFKPISKIETIDLLKTNSPLTKRYLKAAHSPESLKNLKLTPLTDLGTPLAQDIPSKYAKKYIVPDYRDPMTDLKVKDAAYDVDAIDLIFPKESRTFKEDLRKITNAGMNRWDMENPLSMDEVDAHNLGVNQQISDFLSSHGYSVGEYTNSNLAEKFPQSFSIFDRNAVHNWKRIKKLGGPIKTLKGGNSLIGLY